MPCNPASLWPSLSLAATTCASQNPPSRDSIIAPRSPPEQSSSSSSLVSFTSADIFSPPQIPLPCTPPPRPPRPRDSLPNLRPTIILSPLAITPCVYQCPISAATPSPDCPHCPTSVSALPGSKTQGNGLSAENRYTSSPSDCIFRVVSTRGRNLPTRQSLTSIAPTSLGHPQRQRRAKHVSSPTPSPSKPSSFVPATVPSSPPSSVSEHVSQVVPENSHPISPPSYKAPSIRSAITVWPSSAENGADATLTVPIVSPHSGDSKDGPSPASQGAPAKQLWRCPVDFEHNRECDVLETSPLSTTYNSEHPHFWQKKSWQLWLVRYRRVLWMAGTMLMVVVAATAITGGVVWRLTLRESLHFLPCDGLLLKLIAHIVLFFALLALLSYVGKISETRAEYFSFPTGYPSSTVMSLYLIFASPPTVPWSPRNAVLLA